MASQWRPVNATLLKKIRNVFLNVLNICNTSLCSLISANSSPNAGTLRHKKTGAVKVSDFKDYVTRKKSGKSLSFEEEYRVSKHTSKNKSLTVKKSNIPLFLKHCGIIGH